jgi:phosphopantothenoylcysteine decarboxylase/phosphopantothenate--cysteine ligase
MGRSLAAAAIERGHEVVIVSGPVEVEYPSEAEVISVVSTEEMLERAQAVFADCDGLIGVAAPCDYRPRKVAEGKIAKTGAPLMLELVETPDIVATLAATKTRQWCVGFALETDDHRLRALAKLQKKCCDLMVVNHATAMNAIDTEVEIIAPNGDVIASIAGDKGDVSRQIFAVIAERLIR